MIILFSSALELTVSSILHFHFLVDPFPGIFSLALTVTQENLIQTMVIGNDPLVYQLLYCCHENKLLMAEKNFVNTLLFQIWIQ